MNNEHDENVISPKNKTEDEGSPRRKRPQSADSSLPRRKKSTSMRPAGRSSDPRRSRNRSRGKRRSKKTLLDYKAHLIFGGIILFIFLFALIRLIIWNMGTKSTYDPNEINTDFDTEPEDYILPLDSATAALQKDDGITSILLLGNDPFADDRGSDTSLPAAIEKVSGGKVYNGSFQHTYMSMKNIPFSQDYPADAFSLFYVASCIKSKDFSPQRNTLSLWDGDEQAKESIQTLENLDYSAIDVIVIMYNEDDYKEGRMLVGPYDDTLPATCCACLLQSIDMLKEACPQAQIIVSSPYFVYVDNESGESTPADQVDFGYGTLPDYMIAYKNIAVDHGSSFIDNYFGSVNADNYKQYLESDLSHLNNEGNQIIAKRICSAITVTNADAETETEE